MLISYIPTKQMCETHQLVSECYTKYRKLSYQ